MVGEVSVGVGKVTTTDEVVVARLHCGSGCGGGGGFSGDGGCRSCCCGGGGDNVAVSTKMAANAAINATVAAVDVITRQDDYSG
jgi:hypothetical protein